ncbi:sperm microtubule associated protein 2-like isoform X1 [Rattus norvegicus]|uniref:sperm microtubule associated protein 2-like isoform X1 n=1 Tax=Rattus norvegicus TaxID=10116 RepID=UPI0003D0EAF1|nr:testicular haploid expressed gene protein-like isoform X1 [Rattus norvegicus]|eukprot:XP_006250908.1 PREDICTED: testicular haploid expressed gene protein-like isoform X1 [Rattus norvegicus]
MEEGDFSGSEPSEVTDGQNTNTTMTTETHTTTEHQPKPLVVRLLEVHNCDEDEEDEEEEQEEDHEAPKTHKSHEASVSFKSVNSSDSPKASDLPLSCKASDFLGSSKASDPSESFKALQSSESQEDVKDDLFSNAVIRTSPSLMTGYPPQLQLTSLRAHPATRDLVKKCFYSRKRVQDLSRPKKQWGTPDRRLFWGNQEPIRPVSEAALKAPSSKRIEDLAQPRLVSRHYVPNRENLPGTLRYSDPSPRILRLSIAKGTDPNYIPPKTIQTKISFSTLSAVASPRIVDLAHPRIKIEGLCYERERSELPIRPVAPAALLANPSERTIFLAKSKRVHEDYLPVRDARWPISYAATHPQVSERIQELANPHTRSPTHVVYYDPDVFKVKPSALKAHCSNRVKELAEPIVR